MALVMSKDRRRPELFFIFPSSAQKATLLLLNPSAESFH
jgi:hypothetical protein